MENIKEYLFLIQDILIRKTESRIQSGFGRRIPFWTLQRRDQLIHTGVSDQNLLLQITIDAGYAISCEISRDLKQYRKSNPLLRKTVEAVLELIATSQVLTNFLLCT